MEKQYFFILQGERKGPYSFEEIPRDQLVKDTLVWWKGKDDWMEAHQVIEFRDIISQTRQTPSPISPQNSKSKKEEEGYEYEEDYSRVEDIANTNYLKAIAITAAFLAFNIFLRDWTLNSVGIFINTIFIYFIWTYFKSYFIGAKDHETAKWINSIILGTVIFSTLNLFALNVNWFKGSIGAVLEYWQYGSSRQADDLGSSALIINLAYLIGVALVFIGSIKILAANKRHPFPLKRIAVSSLICLPILLIMNLTESILMSEGFTDESSLENIPLIILLLPYILLLIHFYKAEVMDRTQ